jgi:rubrerythrin
LEQHAGMRLTSSEIAALWTQYMNGSAGLCINKYMIKIIEDTEIRAVFEFAIEIGQKQLSAIERLLQKEKYPVPKGFTDEDVNLTAPRLYEDAYCLHYLHVMSIHGTHGYSAAVTTATREDVREYFIRCSQSSTELYNHTLKLLLSKGLYTRAPVISPPERIDFVESSNFLAGWFGDNRQLNCLEISNIFFNLIKSKMTNTLILGYSQVVQSDEVKRFLLNIIEVINDHIQMFESLLTNNDLKVPPSFDELVTSSTTPPFSDKLMMFNTGFLFTVAIVYYGIGLSSSMRTDLTAKYLNAIGGDLKVGADWTDIMIKHKWIEQPPQAIDRRTLANQK